MEDVNEQAVGPEKRCPFHPDCRHPATDHYRTGRPLRQQSEIPPFRDYGWVRVPLPDMQNGPFFSSVTFGACFLFLNAPVLA
jgi:hypothetical protein